jgi:aspartyl-tRNA(Asn)/glutamyl-tRNA(Gln) amidotransferase subunit B
LLVEERAMAEYFETTNSKLQTSNPKAVANWVNGELLRLMKETGENIETAKAAPAQLAALIELVAAGTINLNTAKAVFEEMFRTGRAPGEMVAERGLAQVSDTSAIEKIIEEVLAAHPEQLTAYRNGKVTLEQWFFGQAMKRLQGRGHPQVIRAALQTALSKNKSEK